MKILQINQTYLIGSTGRIMSDLSDVIESNSWESYMLCSYYNGPKKRNLYVMDKISYPNCARINVLRMALTGRNGYVRKRRTKKALKWISDIKPDIIHLHNIHGDWINLKMLFDFIKRSKIPVIWTLHDCWSFTGRCSHFELCGCDKWKTGCYKCKNLKVYPTSWFFDCSKKMYTEKRELFTDLEKVILVTPSVWLSKYVKESFLKQYPVTVINNGVDINVFKKMETSKNVQENDTRRIILGVASSWSETKGLNDFYKLDEIIDHGKYKIVLVGLNSRQLKKVPKSIFGIGRTNNVQELVDLYNKSYVFVNPTYQDNFPTTNLEAQSCGVPVITYKTGGSPESIFQKDFVLEKGDVVGIKNLIESGRIDEVKKEINCTLFNKEKFYLEYIQIYKKLLGCI